MRGRRKFAAVSAWASAVLAVLVAPGSARADRKIAVAAGSCPDRDAVTAALVEAVPDATIVDAPDSAVGATGVERVAVVAVSDDGAHYRAMVDGAIRNFEDTAANCPDRARKIAVVVALAIDPPSIAAPAPSPSAEVVVAATDRPGVRSLWWRGAQAWVQIGYGIAQGIGPRDTMYPTGMSGRLLLDRDRWGVSLGATWSSKEVYAPIRTHRLPVDLSLYHLDQAGPLFSVVEFGASFVHYHVNERGLPSEVTDASEVGGRVAWRIEWRSPWRFGIYASAAAVFAVHAAHAVTATYDVTFPSPWIDVAAGLSARLH